MNAYAALAEDALPAGPIVLPDDETWEESADVAEPAPAGVATDRWASERAVFMSIQTIPPRVAGRLGTFRVDSRDPAHHAGT